MKELLPVFDSSVDNEGIYDAAIEPLMKLVLDVCRQRNMPFVASFQFHEERFANFLLLPEGASQMLLAMASNPYPDDFQQVAIPTAKA